MHEREDRRDRWNERVEREGRRSPMGREWGMQRRMLYRTRVPVIIPESIRNARWRSAFARHDTHNVHPQGAPKCIEFYPIVLWIASAHRLIMLITFSNAALKLLCQSTQNLCSQNYRSQFNLHDNQSGILFYIRESSIEKSFILFIKLIL